MLSYVKYQSYYYQVKSFNTLHCEIFSDVKYLSLDIIWKQQIAVETDSTSISNTIQVAWTDLELPLPQANFLNSWAFGFSYSTHIKEMKISPNKFVLFKKNTPPVPHWGELIWRKHLDFELEIGILLSTQDESVCGFVLLNDYTDRKIQLENYKNEDKNNSQNMSLGFSLSKSFPGALSIVPMISIGKFSDFSQLRAQLLLNGEIKQNLNAEECLLTWELLKSKKDSLSQHHPDQKWILFCTGTPGGTLFHVPTKLSLIKIFLQSGFSIKKTKQKILEKMQQLKIGDEISITSTQLGEGRIKIIPHHK